MPDTKRFDAETALQPLKKFQRRTVDYVIRRLYRDADRTKRFLVADEVGLGKTMVARGVVALTIERLWDVVGRIDVLYICSNQAIASQNINRLNVLGEQAFALPTRMTLLPLQLMDEHGLGTNKVNFISLTPGTTFNLRSSTGVVKERALLFHLLKGMIELDLRNLLQVGAGTENWNRAIDEIPFDGIDPKLVRDFQTRCRECGLLDELRELCHHFAMWQDKYPSDVVKYRNELVGKLRNHLAHVCVDALEPDLVILDEFQRFTELLHSDHDAALLAQALFEYTDSEGNQARTLLLSATPYRMLTLSSDSAEEGNHYEELLETVGFLFGPKRGERVAGELSREIDRFRREMLSLPEANERARSRRASIEGKLRSVIARTERVSSTADRNSMVDEVPLSTRIQPQDLRSAASVAAIARIADAPEVVEYWKSAPYLLNFMRDYALKRILKASAENRPPRELLDAINRAKPSCLDEKRIDAYLPLKPHNARMRTLMDDIFGDRLDRHLWIPPSLPYYGTDPRNEIRTSKALVFSTWSMVPDAVSAILSYEAERRMGVKRAGMNYFDRQRPRPLQFRRIHGRLAGLRALLLIYPSPLIAEAADPLDVVAAHSEPLSYNDMRAALAERLQPFLLKLQDTADLSAEVANWEWVGPAILDALAKNRTGNWLKADEGFIGHHDEDAWPDHVYALRSAVLKKQVDGAVPDHALDLLVDLALGSPAICALRALHRVSPTLAWDDPTLLTAATRIAWGFRTLYNHHDTVALLRRGSGDRYWHSAITYAANNDLQSVLDEYTHCLVESEGLTDKDPFDRITRLADAIGRALSLHPSQIEVDNPRVLYGRLRINNFSMRGRFAMRLADYRDEEGSASRLSAVREAFNSPFRPFVLATTSIGQEGLDFHPYCHRIYHWNLPRNPVDLEQREGRVHRYKGHAIRLNVAHEYAPVVRGCGVAPEDPWSAMFAMAQSDFPNTNGLIPYWICDGPVRVQRRVPLLPYSREIVRLQWLKRSVACYRLAFGQPRQDDLLAYLQGLDKELTDDDLEALEIRLEPQLD